MKIEIPIDVRTRRAGSQPVTLGLPFPKGALRDAERLGFADGTPLAARTVLRWGDGSVKWARLDFIAPAGSLSLIEKGEKPRDPGKCPASDVFPGRLAAVDAGGSAHEGRIESRSVEEQNGIIAVTRFDGRFENIPLRFTARITRWKSSPVMRIAVTVRNNQAAPRAQVGRWLLGSVGAVLLRELAFYPALPGPAQRARLGETAEGAVHAYDGKGALGLYQDSSGGEHWNHVNHVDRDNKVPVQFRGYKVFRDKTPIAEGLRAQPWLAAECGAASVALTAPGFWQNFPGALGIENDGAIRLALWPREWNGPHEIQGGEEKTREIILANGKAGESEALGAAIRDWLRPLRAGAPAEWYMASGVFGPCPPRDDRRLTAYERAVLGGIRDPRRNLITQIEAIDEYGWRNYGDTWADHESDQTGLAPAGTIALSHYNNEYDFGYGMLVQSLRNRGIDDEAADQWFDLGLAALFHEADIDTYHTLEDPHGGGVYNGGQFTHTSHGVPAGRSTHRGSPEDAVWGKLDWPWGRGGGPEDGHFHTRGLVLGYLLCGETRLKEAALEVARLVQWKVENNLFARIDNCSREVGNVIQVLTEAYDLTRDERYRQAVEKALTTSSFTALSKDGKPPRPSFWALGIFQKTVVRWLDLVADLHGARNPAIEDSVRCYALELIEYWVDGGFSYQKGGKSMGENQWNLAGADALLCGARFAKNDAERKRLYEYAHRAFVSAVAWQANDPQPKYRASKPCTVLCGQGHLAAYHAHAEDALAGG